jgi:hypothetical protein
MQPILVPAYPDDRMELIDWGDASIEKADSIDLRMLAPGRLAYFFGVHPDSRYVLKILPCREGDRILIMHDSDIRRLATGPLETIISQRYGPDFKPIVNEAAMIKGWIYCLPNFLTRRDGTMHIDYSPVRMEAYTRILLQPSRL